MKKPLEVEQIANKYSNSLTGDAYLFEQFLIDYVEHEPNLAFERLFESSANDKTRECAEDFNHRYVTSTLNRIEEELTGKTYNPLVKQAKVIQGFFRDYREHGDFSLAWETVQRQVQQDVDLRDDPLFHAHLRDMATKVRPVQKERKNMNIHDDDGTFIKVRLGLPTRYEEKLTDREVRKIVESSLRNFYRAHTTDERKRPQVYIDHEVDAIYKHKQLPLALQLAFEDTRNLSRKVTVAHRALDGTIKTIMKMENEGVKFKINFEKLTQKMADAKVSERVKTSSDKVDIIRDLIINLQNQTTKEAFDTAIKKATEYGDVALLNLIQNNHNGTHSSIETQATLLLDSYALYLPVNTTAHMDEVKMETAQLQEGIKASAVQLALREMDAKGKGLLDANITLEEFQKVIKAEMQKDKNQKQGNQKYGKNSPPQGFFAPEDDESMAAGIAAVAEKNSIVIDYEDARREIEQEQAEKEKNKESGLNQGKDEPDNEIKLNLN